ncbi:MAG TPA: lactate racemase domain-containing protein [Pirellulales bacterium]|nr:lactate racemase domain-containing protein [Pirellulales bacterium]
MSCVLPYGAQSHVGLDLPDETLLAVFNEPRGGVLDDPAAAVAAALDEPLNFPALARATVPGDRIVLALEHGVPQATALVAAVANYLVEHGASADQLAVLIPPAAVAAGERDPRSLLPDAWRDEVALEVHAPDAAGSLSLLASNHEGKPVYMNRTLLDADLVVPIGCLRHEPTIGYYGQYGGLFPTFSDARTQSRFHKPAAGARRQQAAKQREEIDEVGWLLGTQFTVQALPGGGGGLLQVLAGEIPAVFRAGRLAYESAWRCGVPGRASLVVASLAGGREQQTWQNLARALAAASCLVADGGAIAVCTELAVEPGPAVTGLSRLADRELLVKSIRREHAVDALEAIELARATEQARVYLLSRLDESLVEDLGMAHISEPGDVGRLARRHESCIVLSNAQYVVPAAQE